MGQSSGLLPPPKGEGYVYTGVGVFVCLFVCLSVCLIATLRKYGWMDFQDIVRIGRLWHKEQSETFWRWSDRGFIFLFSGSVFIGNIMEGITDQWIFTNFSGYGHKEQLATLFHARIDCFTLLKLGAAEGCGLGVILVMMNIVSELSAFPVILFSVLWLLLRKKFNCISNFIHVKLSDIITHPCTNFHGTRNFVLLYATLC